MKTYKQLLEDVGSGVSGIAGAGEGDEPVVRRKCKERRLKSFVVSDDILYKCAWGKKRGDRYSKYVGNDEIGEEIRQYARKYPKDDILLKGKESGTSLYFRR